MTTPPTSAPEPTSAAIVAGLLGYTEDNPFPEELQDQLDATIAAVNRFVRRVQNPGPDGQWAHDHAQAAKLLGARLWRRRNSIDGVYTLGQEATAYVTRTDPDVAMYLQIGPWAVPVTG